jgi:proline dehydrogenase
MVRQLSSFVVRHPWVRKAAVSTPVVRDLAWRFVAGEDLDAGVAAVRALGARGIRATLNLVGTHVRGEAEAVAAADAVVASLHRIHAEGLDANVSVKLTLIGLDVAEDLCRSQLRRVLDAAARLGVFVRIDMEESPYVDRTLRLFEEMQATHGPDSVGIVLQSYLKHRRGDLGRLAGAGACIRLVKGGYWESAEVVHRARADVDRAFFGDLEALLPRGRRPAIATHDGRAIARARKVASEAGLAPRSFELQMLYGVRSDLQEALARDGYVVRAYVPYGARWYEYVLGCIRRVPGGALRRLGERFLPGPSAPDEERRGLACFAPMK